MHFSSSTVVEKALGYSSMIRETDVAIIGGGVTGLVTAHECRKNNLSFSLWESDTLGGLIRTESLDGFTLECGPNVLLEKPALKNLLIELGLEDSRTFPPKYRQYVWYNGRAKEVPKSPAAFIKTPLLSPSSKLRLLKNLFRRGVLTSSLEDESVKDFFARICGEELPNNLIAPVIQGIFGGRGEELSARSLFPALWEKAREDKSLLQFGPKGKKSKTIVLRGGMKTLIERLLAEVSPEELIEERVELVEPRRDGYYLRGQNGKVQFARRVIVTTSGRNSARFLPFLKDSTQEMLRELTYAPIVVVHCSAPDVGNFPRDAFGVLFPPNSCPPLLGVMFNSLLFPHVSPGKEELITVCLGGVTHPEALMLSESEIHSLVENILCKECGIPSSKVLKITRWERAIPQLVVGHHRYVAALREAEEGFPGMVFSGVDCGGVGVGDRVLAGLEGVKRVLRKPLLVPESIASGF